MTSSVIYEFDECYQTFACKQKSSVKCIRTSHAKVHYIEVKFFKRERKLVYFHQALKLYDFFLFYVSDEFY